MTSMDLLGERRRKGRVPPDGGTGRGREGRGVRSYEGERKGAVGGKLEKSRLGVSGKG